MSSKKIKGVTDFPMPRKMTELRSSHGLTNYFRDHVPNHSNVVASLQKMILHASKKQTLLIWTDEAADAFYMIKQRIAESPLLCFIHDTAPITLMTDASDYGIRGYLYQEVNEKKQLVALVSKSLTKTQLKWSTIQKEAFALTSTHYYEIVDLQFSRTIRILPLLKKTRMKWLADGESPCRSWIIRSAT